MGTGTEAAITKQERMKDVPMTREQFVEAKSANYQKFDADKDYIIGIAEAKYCMRDFGKGEGLKPTMVLLIDNMNGEALDEPVEFSSSSKLLANSIEEYRNNTEVNLFAWLFKIRSTGSGVHTKYALTPSKPRPKA